MSVAPAVVSVASPDVVDLFSYTRTDNAPTIAASSSSYTGSSTDNASSRNRKKFLLFCAGPNDRTTSLYNLLTMLGCDVANYDATKRQAARRR